MDYKKVESLLDKYFEGATSLEEESYLKAYFNSNGVREELKQYQPLFQFFQEEKQQHLSDDFEIRLLQQLEQQQIVPLIAKRRILYTRIARIAAVVILAIGVFWGTRQFNFTQNNSVASVVLEEELTPEEAYEQAMAALMLVSSKLNKGKQKAFEGIGQVNRATKVIKH